MLNTSEISKSGSNTKSRITWKDKYEIAISDSVNTSEITKLFGCCRNHALIIRKNALEYCKKHKIFVMGGKAPTEAVLAVTNRDVEYYYNKMVYEKRIA